MDPQTPYDRRRVFLAYSRFFALILVMAALVLLTGAMTGCDTCTRDCDISRDYFSTNTKSTRSDKARHETRMAGWKRNEYATSGAWTEIRIRSNAVGQQHPSHVTVEWTPPKGASNVTVTSFGAKWTLQPDGTYIIKDWRVYDELTIMFQMPEVPEGQSLIHVSTTAVTREPNGASASVTMYQAVFPDIAINPIIASPTQPKRAQPAPPPL